jgi:FdhD protein
MEDTIYEEMNVGKIIRNKDGCHIQEISKKVIAEISLKVIVNGTELVSVLCLNQYQEELALGFLYNEGVINSYADVENIYFNDKMLAVIINLKEGVIIDRQESLRSLTSGCGKCYTYINPLKKSQYKEKRSSTRKQIQLKQLQIPTAGKVSSISPRKLSRVEERRRDKTTQNLSSGKQT